MKRLSLLLVMIFIVCMSWATIDEYYSFNATTGTYTPITGTAITVIASDDAISGAIPMGFTFAYGDNAYTEVKVSSNGWVGLGTAQTSSNLSNNLNSTTIAPVIAPLWDDLSMASGTVQYLTSGTAPNRIFTVQYENAAWNYSATSQFNFQVRIYETGKIDMIYGSATGAPASASASIGINMLPGGSGWFYSVTPGSPATYSTTTANTAIAAFPAQGTVYEFNPVVAQANDLAAMSITGNTTPTVGTASPYTVTIRNRGTVAQSNYAVKLFNASNVEIGTIAGTAIAPNEILPFVINWTPTTAGPTSIYGKVVLAGDQNTTNDQTAPLSLSVQASGTVAVTIGDGSQTARMPMDFYWKNSLHEYILLASEINLGGLITGIQFYNNFVTNLPDKPTKIWIGETTMTDLSGGWIPSTQLTSVYDGNVTYPSGPNLINITFTAPFAYGGGNLVIMVNRPMDTAYFSSSDYFQCQTVGTARSLTLTSDSTTFDPTAPAAATPTGQFAKTTLFFVVSGMGSMNGTVTVGGQPLAGATVSVATTQLVATTNAQGQYNFPYVTQGTYQVTATKHGYTSVTNNVTVTENQAATSNFILALLPQVTVTGRIVGSDAPTVGLANATINLTGYEPYSATTNATGNFTITGVFASQTYQYTATAVGYQAATGNAVVGTTNLNMGDIVITELTLPAGAVQAEEAGNNVNLTWMAPGTAGGEWLHYDSGENDDSIGTGGAADFDVAIRFPASALADYAGMSLHAVKVWPAQAGTFSLRVWTGGTADAPGTMVVDQAFTPELDVYNTITLTNPVTVTGTEELWFGYRCNVTGGYPAGCDAGPQVEGFGNMIFFNGEWSTLTEINASLTYNWNIQGYVGYSAPTTALGYAKNTEFIKSARPEVVVNNDRALQGYKVWRLLQGQETNESVWTLLTQNAITATGYQDTGWSSLPDGTYRWAVKAVYTNNVTAAAAFSNPLTRLTQVGTIAGLVRNPSNQGIAGATVTCGTVTATTNANGAYSMTVPAGTQSVTASATGYNAVTQTGVVVVTGQTTTVNFQLPVSQVLLSDSFETYQDFVIDFAPWVNVDVDQSGTYGITGTSWTNAYAAQAYIVFNPTTTSPALTTMTAQDGVKMAACFAATTPPNNDWLMTPPLAGGGNITFWAKSHTDQYGLERFKVGVSAGGTNPADFTFISGANYVEAPIEWTQYTYSLAAYAGQQIRIGIQCLSNDAFIFLVDNVVVMGAVANDDPTVPALTTNLAGNYPNPFNPETTIRYSVKDSTPVTIGIYNIKGQLVKTIVNEVKAAGEHSVVWNGTDSNGRQVASGMYYYKMYAGKYSSTKKMILMK